MKRIILTCAGIFLAQLVLDRLFHIAFRRTEDWFALVPVDVLHGEIWQLVTYSLAHDNFSHIFFNMLTLWFIGAYLERDWGPRRFIECYTFCVIGAALVTIAVSYTHFLGMDPSGPGTVGASGGIFGLLMVFGTLYADQEMYLFPLPFRIKAKYLVGIWVVVAIVAVFLPTGGVAVFAHLGGLLFGYLWVKFMPSRGMSYAASERYFGVRNTYYRWKRRRAARKFEVYMRDHDRKVTFDEHGNYIPPDDTDKPNGGSKSGWVN